MKTGVPIPLKSTIQELMQLDVLGSFSLGGGTNLVLKYNHRLSTDIDLFSHNIVGKEALIDIKENLISIFPESSFFIHNKENEQLSWLTGVLVNDTYRVKIDIVQNLKLLKAPNYEDGIRFIDDLDIASLKLETMAGRGSRKDLYDLVLLTDKYDINDIFDLYVERNTRFNTEKDLNIFNASGSGISTQLTNDLGKLINFNNTKDRSNSSNQIVLTKSSPFALDSFINICKLWESRVETLSKNRNIKLTPQKSIPARRKKRGFGF